MSFKRNFRFIIQISIVLIFAFSSSCSENESNLIEKNSIKLLGIGTTIQITPAETWREKQEDITFTIKLGVDGLLAGDSIGIVNGSFIDRWKFSFASHWWGQKKPWQTFDENSSNFITATCSRKEVKLTLEIGEEGPSKPFDNTPDHFVRSLRERMRFVLELSPDQDLQEGDVITIQWRKVETPDFAMHYFFLPFRFSELPELDSDLPIRKGDFYSLPNIRIKGRSAEYLHVTCQPLQSVNDRFSLNIAAIDKFGNLAEDFSGILELKTDFDSNFPEKITLTKEDQGRIKISNLKVNEPGWHRIKVEGDNVSGISNYLVVTNEKPSKRLYYGDMHAHTLDCDGTTDILEHFFYAPKVAGLDFGSVSPHAEYFGCKKAWDRYLEETTRANKPGEFVTFYGYEWAQEGHTNVYFLSKDDAILVWGEKRMKERGHPGDDSQFRIGARNEKEFMDILEKLRGDRPLFTIGHIHSRYYNLNDSIHWFDEIHSMHIRSKEMRETRFRKNLEKGMRIGVVAGSDMHRLTMGHLCKEPGKIWSGNKSGWDQTAGLQATFASGLTRRDLYSGMQNRHSFGTSGVRIVLLFHCNGYPMGSQIVVKQSDNPQFSVQVGGTSDISEIAIFRYDGEEWTESWKVSLAEQTLDRYSGFWEDHKFEKTGIYYVRVIQVNGEHAWSSPIWVTEKKL